MDFKTLTYDLCRCFVRDKTGSVDQEVIDRILGWIRSRNLPALASCSKASWDTSVSRDLLSFLLQVEAFFKKNAVFAEPEMCSAAARSSFIRAERLCRITNRRLDYYYSKRDRLDPDLRLLVSKAEAYVHSTLGEFAPFLESLPKRIRFTNGATASSSRRNSAAHMKISLRMRAAGGSRPYLLALAKYYGQRTFKVIPQSYNRVEVVPKNWKTARTIACEPAGNIPLQLAFDGYAKNRLRRRGIDLSDQSRNQDFALRGSVEDNLSTIDLEMASDTVAFNTVAWLFPQPWFQYLNSIRSTFASGKFGIHKYAKFSSMGNGSTFAIETLVFAAICHGAGAREYTVYGDDIAVDSACVPLLLRGLRFFGFSVNPDKTFIAGPFRESCGTNFYEGCDITPFYVRDWNKLKSQLSHNVNGLASVAVPGRELWKKLIHLVDFARLPLVPFTEDTMSGVFVDVHSAYTLKLIKTINHVSWTRAYKPKSKVYKVFDSRTLFLWHLDRFRVKGKIVDDVLIRTRVPAFVHKYVRKWVHWIPPMVGAPDYLNWWSEDLIHREPQKGSLG